MSNSKLKVEVKTAFLPGDEVWFISNGKAVVAKINRINIESEITENNQRVRCNLHFIAQGGVTIPIEHVFKTKKELIESL